MSKSILLSIHPEHIEKILSGEKVFEFRRMIPKEDVKHIVFYVSSPISKIVGYAKVNDILSGTPSELWQKTKNGAGITSEFFERYFSKRNRGYAFVLENVYRFVIPITISELCEKRTAPQSFFYLSENEESKIFQRRKKSCTKSSLVFMGGIHGVGKTFLCKEVISPFGFKCTTASQLIQTGGIKILKDKKVLSIDKNQDILVPQVLKMRKKTFRFLLDGHFVLRDSNNELKEIPLEVFQAMKLSKIILLLDDIEEIKKRLMVRDGKNWDFTFLDKFQALEEKHALFVANELNIPILIFHKNDQFLKIKKFLNTESPTSIEDKNIDSQNLEATNE